MDIKAIVALVICAVAFVLTLAGVNGPIYKFGKLGYLPNGCLYGDKDNANNVLGRTGDSCDEVKGCLSDFRKAVFAFDIMGCILLAVGVILLILKVLHSFVSAIPELPRPIFGVALGLATLTTLLAWVLGVSFYAAEHDCDGVKIKIANDTNDLGWGVVMYIVAFVLTIPATILGSM